MSDLVLETVEESCAFGEDIVLVGLVALTRDSIEGRLYSETAMREGKSKNTVYSRHQGPK